MLSAVVDAYRRTRKPKDIFWNKFVARPLAAVVIVPLARTRVTPNQITLATLPVFLAGAAMMAFLPSWRMLCAGVALLELSYVLDCADGQLARLKGTSSPVGAHLDFLMDELKAFTLVAAVAVRLWRPNHEARWLLEGIGGLVILAGAISLTTFMRRPEYAAATGAAVARGAGDYGEGFAAAAPTSTKRSPLALVEAVGRFVVHYPSYIVFVALANRMDLFLHAYLAMNAAYAARALLTIGRSLGRTERGNRVDVAGLRPAESGAGGSGDPSRVPDHK
ncbi:MAG TPA: CDP-alcohol phosphatidyltransferase family protein [Polyangia bacterium]|nr:CDP-alcohol phosphatidyltransferase family protein [Polyangia bacterium]